MKLNETYLGVQYETEPTLKEFFLRTHLDPRKHLEVQLGKLAADINPNIYYDKSIVNPWEERERIAKALTESPRHLKRYFISGPVQKGAALVKFEKIDLKWFRDIEDMSCLYILNKDEFYRFNVQKNRRINVLYYYRDTKQIHYESYSIVTSDGKLAITEGMDEEKAHRFVQILLFVLKTKVTMEFVKARSGKVIFDKAKGDEGKLRNLSGIDVQVVTSNWNKYVVVEGDIKVPGHFKLIWTGPGRTILDLRWWQPHTRDGYVRRAGKEKDEEQTP